MTNQWLCVRNVFDGKISPFTHSLKSGLSYCDGCGIACVSCTKMEYAFCVGLAVRPAARAFAPLQVHTVSRVIPVCVPRRARLYASASEPEQSSEQVPPREGRSDDGSRDAEFSVGPLSTEEENELLQVVKSVPPPELVARFTEAAPPVVQGAIRQTLMRMLGSLPPLAFSTSVQTMSSNLVQLFHSCLISGYMFRNAAYRLELTRSLSDLPALPPKENTPEIRGGVVVFTDESGSQVEVPVEDYVNELRHTVGALRNELERERKGGNELLSFLSTMEPKNLEALTANAGEEVIDAMRKVVEAVTVSQGIKAEENKLVATSSFELGQLLFYLMVNGFFLREAEVRVELQRKLKGDSAPDFNKRIEGGPSSSPEA